MVKSVEMKILRSILELTLSDRLKICQSGWNAEKENDANMAEERLSFAKIDDEHRKGLPIDVLKVGSPHPRIKEARQTGNKS